MEIFLTRAAKAGRNTKYRAIAATLALTVVAFGHCASAKSTTDNDWSHYGLHTNEDRSSSLSQINDTNVGGLGLAWSLDLPERGPLEATPLEVSGILYVNGGFGAVYAIDAQTGALRWRHDPHANEADPRGVRRMYAANRGMAYWKGRVYVCTRDGRMIALDAKTGKVVWTTAFIPPNTNSTSTGAPRAAGGNIVIGTSGSEFAGRGSVTAVDAATGAIAWRFFTVPGNPSSGFEDSTQAMAATTWSGDWWKFGGGGNPWNAITYDAQLEQLYIGTGNAAPWLDKVRSRDKQDNLFTSSIVALDAKTGTYKWHYQTTPDDVWDYDAVADIILTSLKVDGNESPILMQANKNGFFYVLDRRTGKLISAEKFADANWADHIDLSTGRPVETAGSRYTKARITIYPGMYGAHDWQAMSYNPHTGLAYIPAIRIGAVYAPSEEAEAALLSADERIKTNQGVDAFPVVDRKNGIEKRGSLVAWDPKRQTEAWRVDFPAEFNGGTLTTFGNLVFQGLTNGQINAFAADSGKKLWSFDAKLGVLAPPITFEANGKQFVSLVVGYGAGAGETEVVGNMGWKYGAQPRRLLTFTLGGGAKLPATPSPDFTTNPLDNPSLLLDEAHVKAGSILYDQVCSGCHGAGGVANGGAPELRASTVALDASTFRNVLQQGLLVSQGMPKFDDFSNSDVQNLYEFIRFRARESLKAAGMH